MKATYKEIPMLLKNREPFRAGTVTALKSEYWGKTRYTVYSYDTVIYEEFNGNCSYINKNYYSPTTSRIQNIIKQVFREEIEK